MPIPDPPALPTRPWFSRPLTADDLTIPAVGREAWADDIGAVTLDRMRMSWPRQTITHWLFSGQLLSVQGIIPSWTLQPLAPPVLAPAQDGPYMPHSLIAEVSRQVMAGTMPSGVPIAELPSLGVRVRTVLDWWHSPNRILSGATPREGLELSVMPQLMLYAAYASAGKTAWLPPGMQDLVD